MNIIEVIMNIIIILLWAVRICEDSDKLLPKEIRQEKSKVNAGQDSKVRCILHSKCRTGFKSEVHIV